MRNVGCALVCLSALCASRLAAAEGGVQESAEGIRHSMILFGAETYRVAEDGAVGWQAPLGSRDGWIMPNGHVLLAASKSKSFPSGAIIELDAEAKAVFTFKGTQSEVDAVQPLADGHILMTESGPKPRLLEIDRKGKVIVEFPLQCQITNFHMQTRMARKLPSGNYLVPHLWDKVVNEYSADGKIVWQAKTPATPAESWPFTAIRLDDGNTLISCTHGSMVIEVDKNGKIVWQVTNEDLPRPLLKDPCGVQRLANGNTVITSYGAAGVDEVKMLEVTPQKQIVWTYRSNRAHGVHEFQIVTTNGKGEAARK